MLLILFYVLMFFCFIKVNQHSTLIGKFWITFMIVFRIVVVSSVGDRVYSDEQSEFKCNTMQVFYRVIFVCFRARLRTLFRETHWV